MLSGHVKLELFRTLMKKLDLDLKMQNSKRKQTVVKSENSKQLNN
jgi:hypothetical protein